MAMSGTLGTMLLLSLLPACLSLQYNGTVGALARGNDVIPVEIIHRPVSLIWHTI